MGFFRYTIQSLDMVPTLGSDLWLLKILLLNLKIETDLEIDTGAEIIEKKMEQDKC